MEDYSEKYRTIDEILRDIFENWKIIVIVIIYFNSAEGQAILNNQDKYIINNRIIKAVNFENIVLNDDSKVIKVDTILGNIGLKKTRNHPEYLNFIPSVFPLNNKYQHMKILSNFNYRIHPISKKLAFHNGIDLPAERKSLVYATADGVVAKIYQNPRKGIGYGIRLIHQYGYASLYGHLLFLPKFALGDSITRGQVIGYVGSTGLSTGYHLHYTIYYKNKAVNPLIYCKLLEKL